MSRVTDMLTEAEYSKKALGVGDKLPDGTLVDHKGHPIKLSDVRGSRPLIISFYRGSWCPYCNLELAFYDDLLKDTTNQNVKMIAISPEKPDMSLKKLDIEKLHFTVLSDQNNHYAKVMNLVFQLPRKLVFYYRLLGVNLKKSQNNPNDQLPIPATYIVNREGIISHAWLDVDYTKRAEPEEVIQAYHSLL